MASTISLSSLAVELMKLIATNLEPADLCSLRLADKALHDKTIHSFGKKWFHTTVATNFPVHGHSRYATSLVCFQSMESKPPEINVPTEEMYTAVRPIVVHQCMMSSHFQGALTNTCSIRKNDQRTRPGQAEQLYLDRGTNMDNLRHTSTNPWKV